MCCMKFFYNDQGINCGYFFQEKTLIFSVGGVLLGYEDVVLDEDNIPTEIHLDIDYIHVKLKVNY